MATNIRAYLNNPSGSNKTLNVYSMVIDSGAALPQALAAANNRTEFLEDEQMFVLGPGHKVGINIPIGIGLTTNYQVVVYGIVI